MSAMSVTHRGRPAAPPTAHAPPASLPATRIGRRRWQDPRLWIGILLVASSVLVASRILAAADDTVAVWRLDDDLEPGQVVTEADLEVADVQFDGDDQAAAYVSADEPLPSGLRTDRALGSGELLPAAALTSEEVAVPRELPLGVSGAGVPSGLAVGDRVDVWAVPADAGTGAPQRVLEGVSVVARSEAGPSGVSADQQVLVALPDGVDLGTTLDALNGQTVVLVRVGS